MKTGERERVKGKGEIHKQGNIGIAGINRKNIKEKECPCWWGSRSTQHENQAQNMQPGREIAWSVVVSAHLLEPWPHPSLRHCVVTAHRIGGVVQAQTLREEERPHFVSLRLHVYAM